jgi:hypothetical protein
MESWTASDIALVISTAATGLTALAAFALPPLSNHLNARSERKRQMLESAMAQIEVCTASMDEVVIHLNNESMRLAYLNVGQSPLNLDKEKESKYIELQSLTRRIGLRARYLKVDPREFELAVSKLFSTRLQYIVSDGRLSIVGGDDAANRHWQSISALLTDVTEKGADLLLTLQKNL